MQKHKNKNQQTKILQTVKNPWDVFCTFFCPRLDNWLYTLIIPVILAPLIDGILNIFWPSIVKFGSQPIWKSLFYAPIIEEFIYRAGFIGLLGFLFVLWFKTQKIEIKNEKMLYAALLIFSSLSFALSHTAKIFTIEFLGIFLNGFLYGFLYLWNDKNLLPPIIAHAAGNLFLLLLT